MVYHYLVILLSWLVLVIDLITTIIIQVYNCIHRNIITLKLPTVIAFHYCSFIDSGVCRENEWQLNESEGRITYILALVKCLISSE